MIVNNKYISTNVNDRNIRGADADEQGVLYRRDGRKLMRCDNKSLTRYVIKEGTEVIAERVFADCKQLKEIIIPDSVVVVGRCAFQGCTSLTEIVIPKNVTIIEEWAFVYCKKLAKIVVDEDNPAFCSVDGVLFSKDMTVIICYPAAAPFTSYKIPEGVTTIKKSTFEDHTSLTELVIPKSVTEIETLALRDCMKLSKIIVDEANPTYYSVDGVLYSKDMTTLICCPATSTFTSYEIPDSVRIVKSWAFYHCVHLTQLTIGRNVISIEASAFVGCPSLVHVNFYATACEEADRPFNDCNHHPLSTVNIGDNVTIIPKSLFAWCYALKEIVIPESVMYIGSSAFKCCAMEHITIPANVTKIEDSTFSNCEKLKSITLPDTITSIGKYAFFECKNLTEFTVPKNIKKIEDSTFSGCEKLTKLSLPAGLTSIGIYAFSGCSQLDTIKIPRSVTSIGLNALPTLGHAKVCLEEGNNAYCIVDDVLYTKDMTILIKNLNPFREGLFIIPLTVKIIGEEAFMHNDISSIILPEGITHIRTNAFASCWHITSITLPSTMKFVGMGSFACVELKTITSLSHTPPKCYSLFSMPEWDDEDDTPFSTCTLRVPKGCKEAYASAIEWCEFKNIEEID